MSDHIGSDPAYGPVAAYEVQWTFWNLPRLARDYIEGINRIWRSSELEGGMVEMVWCDHLQQVVRVHVRVVADDLLRAVDWAAMLLFGLLERAGLEWPPSVAMMAEAQAQSAPVKPGALL